MMHHSDSSSGSNSNDDPKDKDIDFGSLLAEARKAKNYTIDEISEYLKIPARTITALETNDKEALPAPTFAQGYIRTYAKFLEISEEKVLDIYNRAVPHDDVSDLKPRSNLPGEASSQSPLIKTITISLIIAGIAAVGFGSYQYYQEKAGILESELDAKQQSFTGNSLDSPGAGRLNIKQDARLTDDDELIVEKSDPVVKPAPVRNTSVCLPCDPTARMSRSRLKAMRGRKPMSSSRLKAVKKMTIGGSITAMTVPVPTAAPPMGIS